MSIPTEPWIVNLRPDCKRVVFGADKFKNLTLYQGDNLIYDEDLIHEILRCPGSVDVNQQKAQEAVDLGYITAEAATALGYRIVIGKAEDGSLIYAKAPEQKQVRNIDKIPDFETWNALERQSYAEVNGIVFARSWGPQEQAAACRAHAQRMIDKRIKAEVEEQPEKAQEPKPVPEPEKKRGRKKARK